MRKPVTTAAIRARKGGKDPITLVTAFDYPMARWADQAGIDIVMVSDAFATIGQGRETLLSATVDEAVYHTRAVRSGSGACLTVATLPFLSYARRRDAVDNAGRLVKEGGAHAVEIEGDSSLAPTVRALHEAGIAVLAHVGLTKTIASRVGGYRIQGRTADEAKLIVADAEALADAGAFALLIECVPSEVANAVTRRVAIPTIGIGAGPSCDGQALVSHDLLGMFDKFCPKFVKRYAEIGDTAIAALGEFRDDVAAGRFPAKKHSVAMDKDAAAALAKAVKRRKT